MGILLNKYSPRYGISIFSIQTKISYYMQMTCNLASIRYSTTQSRVGAFSYAIADLLFVQFGLIFGNDFSPISWEICHHLAEQMNAKFPDNSLIHIHKFYLHRLCWVKSLQTTDTFIQVQPCKPHTSICSAFGRPVNALHFFFVDNSTCTRVYKCKRLIFADVVSIETILLFLGDLT